MYTDAAVHETLQLGSTPLAISWVTKAAHAQKPGSISIHRRRDVADDVFSVTVLTSKRVCLFILCLAVCCGSGKFHCNINYVDVVLMVMFSLISSRFIQFQHYISLDELMTLHSSINKKAISVCCIHTHEHIKNESNHYVL